MAISTELVLAVRPLRGPYNLLEYSVLSNVHKILCMVHMYILLQQSKATM